MDEQPLSARNFGAAFKGFLEQAVTEAPTEETSFARRLREHLSAEPAELPIVGHDFDSTDQPNVQVALDAYLERPGRSADVVGFTSPYSGFQPTTLAQLIARPSGGLVGGPHIEEGPVEYTQVDLGEERVLTCIQSGLLLVRTEAEPVAAIVSGGGDRGPYFSKIAVQAMARERETAERFLADLRLEARRRNVYRGRVISLERQEFGPPRVRPHELRRVERGAIVLPEGVLERVERHTIGFARHVDRLRAAGRHVRRGLLLHGPAGTGKTLTVMYVVGEMSGRTVVLLTGAALALIESSISLARALEPSIVVLEDVDLIAEERTHQAVGTNAVLFELLNQMDGLAEDADIVFLLTTNRPDLLEPALASRPGRIDQAVEIPLPDSTCRRRLFELYSQGLALDVGDLERVVERTRGVSPAFIRELLRKAALFAADEDGDLVVRDRHLDAALQDLVLEGGELTRSLLGAQSQAAS